MREDYISKLEAIQRKWFFHVLFVLYRYEKVSFNMLKRSVTPITSRVLALRLRDLVKVGFVVKDIVVEKPLRVEYYLSENGKEFLQTMKAILENCSGEQPSNT